MKVLNTRKFQREGNDCLIQEIISLTQVFDCYTIYIHTKYVGGWCDDKIRQETIVAENKKEAKKIYNDLIKEMTVVKEMKGYASMD